MNEFAQASGDKRNIWMRGLYMLLMAIIFHLSETVMLVVAVVQFILALVTGGPNDRLCAFGRNLGRYLQQVASFLTFASEEIPFPFSEWPAD